MASWVQVLSTSGVDNNRRNIDTNGVDEIYLSRSNQINVYDVIADTLTVISALDAGTGGVISGPIFFENNLYCATYEGVYRYTGVGSSWNLVDSLPGFPETPSLGKSVNHLVCSNKDVNTTSGVTIRYSADGSSWSNGSVDSTPALPSGSYNNMGFSWYNPSNHKLGLYGFDQDQLGAITPSSPSRYRLMRWDENSTTLVTEFYYTQTEGGVPSGDTWIFEVYEFPDILHWGISGGNVVYDSSLDGTFSTPADPSIGPVRSVGFNTISTGWSSPSSNLIFHQMVSLDQWDAGEIIDTDANAGTLRFMVRMTSGDIYAITGSTRIYARDTPIDDGEIPDNGKRLWIYRGNGIDWVSRGLKVP